MGSREVFMHCGCSLRAAKMFFLPLEGMILFRADETMASRGTGLDGDPSFGQRQRHGVKPARPRVGAPRADRVASYFG
jgi:hypothetical protein